jgi:ADP-ribose pyrophosphatase YjhB (NUDIX family)
MNEPRWLAWARELQAIAQKARQTKPDPDDPFFADSFSQIQTIAAEITSSQSDLTVEKLVQLFEGEKGYATPKIAVRAAIFDGPHILLVKHLADGLWGTPGGYVEVNETPAQAVQREVLEETGFQIRATRLLAVRNLQRLPDESIRFFSYYGLYFDCEVIARAESHPDQPETSEAAFHPLDDLPPTVNLSGQETEAQRRARAERHYHRLYELHSNPALPADFE